MITAGRCIMLVIEKVDTETVTAAGSSLKPDEIKDINRSRSYVGGCVRVRDEALPLTAVLCVSSYLEDLAKRHDVPVFGTVEECVAQTIKLVRQRRRM